MASQGGRTRISFAPGAWLQRESHPSRHVAISIGIATRGRHASPRNYGQAPSLPCAQAPMPYPKRPERALCRDQIVNPDLTTAPVGCQTASNMARATPHSASSATPRAHRVEHRIQRPNDDTSICGSAQIGTTYAARFVVHRVTDPRVLLRSRSQHHIQATAHVSTGL